MITGLPSVSSRNFRRSDFKRQGKAPARPMTPLSARATGPKVRWTVNALDCYRRADARVSFVIFDNDVLRFELKQVVPGEQLQPWEMIWSACQLALRLFEVIQVKMRVAQRMHEFPRLKVGDLGDHVRQQCVAGDIEGHAQKYIGGALIQLAGKSAIRDIELKETVTWGQSHVVNIGRVPGRYDMAPTFRTLLYRAHDLGDLIYRPAVGRRP